MFVTNAWYAAATIEELGAAEILGRRICDKPIVLFRRADGTACALEDRCCHRNMRLSKGTLRGSCLECGYHGLQFDGSGRCVAIPGQTEIPPHFAIRAYPLEEKHGLLRVWLGEPSGASNATIPDLRWYDDPQWRSVRGMLAVDCHYQLLIDNLLDLTHETYVHPTSIGHRAIPSNPIQTNRSEDRVTVSRTMPDHDPAPMFKEALGITGHCDRMHTVTFTPASTIVLEAFVAPTRPDRDWADRSDGITWHIINVITPVSEDSCLYFWGHARNFRIEHESYSDRLAQLVPSVLREDGEVLRVQHQAIAEHGMDGMNMIRADIGVLHARRVIAERLRAEQT